MNVLCSQPSAYHDAVEERQLETIVHRVSSIGPVQSHRRAVQRVLARAEQVELLHHAVQVLAECSKQQAELYTVKHQVLDQREERRYQMVVS